MNFENLFNIGDSEKMPKSNLSLVEELIKEASANFKQDTKLTQQDVQNAFIEKHGDPHKFLLTTLKKMTSEFEAVSTAALNNHVQKKQEKVPATVIAAGALGSVKDVMAQVLFANLSSPGEAEAAIMQSALMSAALNEALPDENMKDDMISVMALIGLLHAKLAEMSVTFEGQELARKKFGL